MSIGERTLLLLSLALVLLPTLAPAESDIAFSGCPDNMQLVPRDLLTNTGLVSFSGTVINSNWNALVVQVYREGAPISSTVQPLAYTSGVATFSLGIGIPAETAGYGFDITLSNATTTALARSVTNVVAGDVFVVQGQSNAEARQFSGSANGNQDPFVRAYGWAGENGAITATETNWYMAEGNLNRNGTPGRVGQWPLRMGRLLRDATGVPVAIFNGAHGGQPISFFQRNDSNPLDLATNYGRLLWRATTAGVANHVRAIIWYQGESDSGNATVHANGFIALHQDWLADYPGIEQFYVFQLRVGCGVTAQNVGIRDFQRRLPDLLPDFSVMATTGVNAHDGCHYAYAGGYEVLGNRIAALILRDLYGIDGGAVEAPNPLAVYLTTEEGTELVVQMRNPTESLGWGAGAEALFRIDGADVVVTNGSASGNILKLELSAAAPLATNLTYFGHSGAGPWVTNTAGIGLLTFIEPIQGVLDWDQDQLPDSWEVKHFGGTNLVDDASADYDKDGSANGDEYIAGTGPADPLDFPSLTMRRGAHPAFVYLDFETVSNRLYEVLYRPDLALGQWNVIHSDRQGDGALATVRHATAGAASAYYRLDVHLP